MEKITKAISELTFASFFGGIEFLGGTVICFKAKYNFHRNHHQEEFFIYFDDGDMILSDRGKTLKNLNNVYHLEEPDVIKNIVAVLKHCNIGKRNNTLYCRIDHSKEIIPQIWRFLRGINFLYSMKLFYS